jgi:large conductance mechanosensitive channel
MDIMLKEFKDFAMRGNVIDLAVGVIIGGAFGKIVTSLVNDLIMPLLGLILGNVNFKNLKIVLKAAQGDVPESAILYGAFIQNVFDFLLIALSIFIVVRLLNRLKRKQVEEKKEEAPALPAEDIVLLTEIRDLLKK